MITFADNAKLESYLSYDKDSLFKASNVIKPYSAYGSTNLTDAFLITIEEFVNDGRLGVMRMVILITDGEPSKKNEAAGYASLLKSMPGTLIWGIFVKKVEVDSTNWFNVFTQNYTTNNDGAEYLREISSPNCFIESDYNNLVEQVKKLDICL